MKSRLEAVFCSNRRVGQSSWRCHPNRPTQMSRNSSILVLLATSKVWHWPLQMSRAPVLRSSSSYHRWNNSISGPHRLEITALPNLQNNLQHFRTYRTSYSINRNRKLEISTAPTKAKSREPAYSQALVQNKSIGSGSDSESQADSRTAMVDGVWSWDGEGGREKRIGFVEEQYFKLGVKELWRDRPLQDLQNKL